MIQNKELKTQEDFESLKRWDYVACEFHRNIHDYPKVPYRFWVFKIYMCRKDTKEIILQKKNNIYFNYWAYIEWESWWNLKSAVLIKQIT